MRNRTLVVATFLVLTASLWAGSDREPRANASKRTAQTAGQPASPAAQKKKFVLDVVRMAVALPQPDPQDRLRVLNSAASVSAPIAPRLARQFAREGARLEAELIASGQTPAVSLLSSGHVDCPTAVNFIESLPPSTVHRAEDSILGAITLCSKFVLEPTRQKLETALNSGVLAARGLLAVMEASGVRSPWSQTYFGRMFGSLPDPDSKEAAAEAPNFAAMFNRMAPEVDKDVARDAGLKMLAWLGKVKAGNNRNIALNLTNDTLQQVLGEKAYAEALRTNPVAQSVAQNAGQPGEVEHPEEEIVSVLEAMGRTGSDQSEALVKLPPSRRAREAAANGFATRTGGDRKMAERYFDIAFSAVDEV
ncbi:MAG: hypothetical protein L0Z53_08110, partial [Acidobacteriales bacterium]|nr:hypothetical protein [Terriglobales bacterium]